MRHVRPAVVTAAASVLLLAGCGSASSAPGDGPYVVATTEIIKDLVENVGGERVRADTIVPPGGDPHSYEPTPEDAAGWLRPTSPSPTTCCWRSMR